MQFELDVVKNYNAAYIASNISRTKKTLLLGLTAESDMKNKTKWYLKDAAGKRTEALQLETGLWTALDGGNAKAYVTKFFDMRREWFKDEIVNKKINE